MIETHPDKDCLNEKRQRQCDTGTNKSKYMINTSKSYITPASLYGKNPGKISFSITKLKNEFACHIFCVRRTRYGIVVFLVIFLLIA